MIDRVTRLARIGSGRVVRAWHQHMDDLGLRPDGYRNILMFMEELDRLSGGDWFAMRADMPRVRLAGGPAMAVHWHAVYFAAAAQVGMDERGRGAASTAGQGHYVPAGGFHRFLTEISDMLSQLANEGSGRARHARTTPILSVMAESDGGRQILFGARDSTFHRILAARVGGEPAERAMLDRVQARVVTPYEGDHSEGAALRRELRDHGYYLPTSATARRP